MSNIDPQQSQEIINKVLENLPTNAEEVVELPSKGYLYNKTDENKPITIRPMNFEDEKAVASQKNKTDIVNLILSRCVSNINIFDLIGSDKLFLLLKLREISYGDDYHCSVVCPHCETPNDLNIKITQLPVKYAEEGFSPINEVFLSGIKKKAKVRLITGKDEVYFKDVSNSINHIWRFVEEIDGVKEKPIISEIIKKLPSRDVKKIVKTMRTDIGVDTSISFTCFSCNKNNLMDLPITEDFFGES